MPQIKRQNWGQSHTILPKLDLVKLQIDSYKSLLEVGIK